MAKFRKQLATFLITTSLCSILLWSSNKGDEKVDDVIDDEVDEWIDELISSVDPTEEKDGSKNYKNSVTGKERTEVIPKLDKINYEYTFVEPTINAQGTYDKGSKIYSSEKYGTFTVDFTIYQTYKLNENDIEKSTYRFAYGDEKATSNEEITLYDDSSYSIKTTDHFVITCSSLPLSSLYFNEGVLTLSMEGIDLASGYLYDIGYVSTDFKVFSASITDTEKSITSTDVFGKNKEYVLTGVLETVVEETTYTSTKTINLTFTINDDDQLDLIYTSDRIEDSKGDYNESDNEHTYYRYLVQDGNIYLYTFLDAENDEDDWYSCEDYFFSNFQDLTYEKNTNIPAVYSKEVKNKTFTLDANNFVITNEESFSDRWQI